MADYGPWGLTGQSKPKQCGLGLVRGLMDPVLRIEAWVLDPWQEGIGDKLEYFWTMIQATHTPTGNKQSSAKLGIRDDSGLHRMALVASPPRGIVVFSGGSAANNLVDVFEAVRQNRSCPLSYIIPISDNGGSSSELIRVFGGPGIGDVRNLFDSFQTGSTPPADAAHNEWYSIVEGTSPLWNAITPAKKELIRSFLNHLNLEILKRARPPSSTFDFTSASVGNLFLTGARLFTGSFESAIYLLGSICSVPLDSARVIPAINSNFSHHISASLADGTVIVGQNSISHPSETTALQPVRRRPSLLLADGEDLNSESDDLSYEDSHLPGSLPTLRNKNITFSKSTVEELPCRISRVWYINPYGQEIKPPANPRVLEAIRSSQAIIYSIGSLYTSLIPSIILRGVGQALSTCPARHKILILNGSLDRETGPATHPFAASDFVEALVRAGEESHGRSRGVQRVNGTVAIPESCHGPVKSASQPPRISVPYTAYVTHIIHLEGPGTPRVDRERLAEMGIECLRVYGRKVEGQSGEVLGMRYDSTALTQALEMVLGKKGDAMVGIKSRRNTMESMAGR
uniref:MEE18 protein n=1 Tax=Coccidioides posadasii RMSCC 3488 TaxID=454284 RepID=A0A0J6IJ53_COCPO|nr:MEE18 protein [Coccidioides posadasii RMSCC 3488]